MNTQQRTAGTILLAAILMTMLIPSAAAQASNAQPETVDLDDIADLVDRIGDKIQDIYDQVMDINDRLRENATTGDAA